TRADGSTECLLRVNDYDFSHQETFLLKNPVTLHTGDQLRVECHWDNTAANQPIINGQQQTPRDVNWGEGTTDEMCLGNFLFSTQ
ncbi:MAG TPA: monooxygenase, partial [Polyangiaceae bacterium]|nr:monooxygenase [Polyangiaceae bacterium]